MQGRGSLVTRVLVFLGLTGLGLLLFRGTGHVLNEGMAAPWLVLILTILLALCGSLLRRAVITGGHRPSRLWLVVYLLSLTTLGGLSIHSLGRDEAGDPQDSRPAPPSMVDLKERQAGRWDDLMRGLPEVMARTVESLPSSPDSLRGGDLFRTLESLRASWPSPLKGGDIFPVEAIVWRAGQRVAWTRGAVPLDDYPVLADSEGLARGRRGWVLRRLRSVGPGLTLELQVLLGQGHPLAEERGLAWQVIPLDEAPLRPSGDGPALPDVLFADTETGLGLVLAMDPGAEPGPGARRERARIMLGAGLAWFAAVLAAARLWWGLMHFIIAFWAARWVLAGAGFFRWGTWAFPQETPPAPPDKVVSLLDPAYFATPFAGGFFASTLDALLTATLLAVSVWALLRARKLAGGTSNTEAGPRPLPWVGQGPRTGILFGLGGFLVLAAVRHLAHLVATNANPRLIGESVPLSFLSFWSLHLVLMLLGLALFALLLGLAAHRPWPQRGQWRGWLLGAVLGTMAALAASRFLLDLWWGGHVLLALIVLGLWILTPAVAASPRFLRRFAWPAVLLMAVLWNYASLSEIYQRTEHTWLQTKARDLARPTNSSGLFLLNEALGEMRDLDASSDALPLSGSDVWRDEGAYQLWRSSSLRDMGFPMSVDIRNEYDLEESYFATGFMGDTHYEIFRRTAVPTSELPDLGGDASRSFTEEDRGYADGDEKILRGRISRRGDRGDIMVEFPIRSGRLESQLAELTRGQVGSADGYRPRSEVDRPVLLLRGDDLGWVDVGPLGIPDPTSRPLLDRLRNGDLPWARIPVGGEDFLCLWQEVNRQKPVRPNEGYLLGLRLPTLLEKLLDLSRLMLLNLIYLGLLVLLVHLWRGVGTIISGEAGATWSLSLPSGFQERFLSGYLFFGLLLLLVVGTAVDRMGHERIRREAADRTRAGLDTGVQQLRALLVEQASSLSRSDYINEMVINRLEGKRPVADMEDRQAMVFDQEGNLILDETLSNLTPQEAEQLLGYGRSSPMMMMQDDWGLFAAVVIPIDLSEVLAIRDTTVLRDGRIRTGFFLYRQRLDRDLLGSLADLVQGEATVRLAGRPVLASHPEGIFSGREPLLADPGVMSVLLDHGQAAGVFASSDRPFALTGAQPMPFFQRTDDGRLRRHWTPAVLALAFPDREREYADQRRQTNLYLAGMANLILLTALLLALLMSWNLFRPLRLLLTATRSLARGDFHAPLPEAGRDEVGRLTDAFRGMRSDLNLAREELESRERFLSLVLDRVTVGVAVVDEDCRVISLNPAGKHILTDFDPSADETQGVRNLHDRFANLAEGRLRWAGETRSADGLRTLRGALAPLDLPDGRRDTMLVFEDITEFLQTRKMAINAELARQVAHEIKNPLTPIQLSVQLLQQAWRDEHPHLDRIVPDTVERVLAQVDLLRTIASEFSLLGRPDEIQREVVDFLAAVRLVVDRYGSGNPDAPLTVEVDEAELPPVLAEDDGLQKILGNLMQNSLDALEEGHGLKLTINWRVEAERVTLIWADNGSGLDPEVADRLFDPYFSTKSKGTGLGLAICRNLADRMGGSIILRNRPDGPGALAELTLPRLFPEGTAS